jgi:hypothetical protein
VGRLEDGDDARDGGFDDRSSAQLLFRTDSLGARSLRQDGAPSRAIVQGQPGTNVCEPREGFQPDYRPDASIQPHGRFETSMIRGVRFTTTLECVCRDAQLTSAMATSVRATPGDRASAELPSRTRGSVPDGGTPEQRASEPPQGGPGRRGSNAHWSVHLLERRDCPRRRLARSSRSTAQAEARDRRTLEGNQAQEGRRHSIVGNGAAVSPTRLRSNASKVTPIAQAVGERPGGNGRGDAVRLVSRTFFEGYETSVAGKATCGSGRDLRISMIRGERRRKHDEPQDR